MAEYFKWHIIFILKIEQLLKWKIIIKRKTKIIYYSFAWYYR
jgi:hypothetical protein